MARHRGRSRAASVPRMVVVTWTCAVTLVRIAWLVLWGRLTRQSANRAIGECLRVAFTRLSGAFIKFGQLLAMRPDLLAEDIISCLEALLDKVEPEPVELSKATLAAQWSHGFRPEMLRSFLPTPVGSGTFATVYRAALADGTEVAIKVQRSDVAWLVRADIGVLRIVGRLVDWTGALRRFRLLDFVNDFAVWTTDELDYVREARQLSFLKRGMADAGMALFVPTVHWTLTTPKVLVVDFLSGTWATELSRAPAAGGEEEMRGLAADALFHGILFQVFELGFFHADPHAGNVVLLPNGKVGLIDFGIVGSIPLEMKNDQLRLLAAINAGDVEAAFRAIVRVLFVPPDAELVTFRARFERSVRDWQLQRVQPTLAPAERSAARLLVDNFKSARECGLSFNSSAVRYYRAFLVLDAVVLRLDPAFDLVSEFGRYLVERYYRKQSASRNEVLRNEAMNFRIRLQNLGDRLPSILAVLEDRFSPQDLIDESFSRLLSRASAVVSGLSGLATWLSVLAALAWLASFSAGLAGYFGGLGGALGLPTTVPPSWLLLAALALFVVSRITAWISRLLWINAFRKTALPEAAAVERGRIRKRR
ncbi:MAG: ABC1 kinase family protein [Cypionkella sp.]